MRSFSAWALGLLMALAQLPLSAQSVPPQPNIILITVDDMNDWTGFLQGHPQTHTPNLDRLARDGASFQNAFCNSPLCSPSRTSFLTGKDPNYTGIYNNEQYKDAVRPELRFRAIFSPATGNETVYTLPEWLKDSAGYYTLGINKVFPSYKDFDLATADPCAKGLSWNEVMDIDPGDPVPAGMTLEDHEGIRSIAVGRLDDAQEGDMPDFQAVTAATDFLDDYGNDPGDFCNRPFFLALGLDNPHIPLFIPERYFMEDYPADWYALPFDLPFNYPRNSTPPNGVVLAPQPYVQDADFHALDTLIQTYALGLNHNKRFNTYPISLSPPPVIQSSLSIADRMSVVTESAKARVTMAYLAAIRFVDTQIGRVLDALEEDPELAANTVVVVLSDHGLALGTKKHWMKNHLWDTDLRVPFLIYDPRRSEGLEFHDAVSLLDLFPTLCDLAGVGEPRFPDGSPYLDGRSLLPLIEQTGAEAERPVLSSVQNEPKFEEQGCYPFYSVRSDRFHYIYYRFGASDGSCTSMQVREELYDVGRERQSDPHEWYNLADDPDYQPVKNWLATFLPGGSQYGGTSLEPRIEASLPCRIGRDDTLTFEALRDQPGPPPYQWKWSVPGIDSTWIASQLVLDLGLLPDTVWDSRDRLPVYLEALDSLGSTLGIDLLLLDLDSLPPDPSFSATLEDSSTVTFFPMADESYRHEWDFGDGIVVDQGRPAPHLYTAPGEYVVAHRLYYGHGCEASSVDTLVMTEANFTGACLTPNKPSLLAVSPDRARLAWNEVNNAPFYNYRIRPSEPNTTWVVSNSPSGFLPISGLDEDRAYEVQVAAICDGTTLGEWSQPLYFRTEPCRPPFQPELLSVSDSEARLGWIPRPEETGGTEVYLYEGPVFHGSYVTVPEAGTLLINGLHAETDYIAYMKSRCMSLFGIPTYLGKTYANVDLTTTAGPGTREGAVAEEGPVAGFRVWPNPAGEALHIALSGTADRLYELELIDPRGRSIRRFSGTGGDSLRGDVSTLSPGTYFLMDRQRVKAIPVTIE